MLVDVAGGEFQENEGNIGAQQLGLGDQGG